VHSHFVKNPVDDLEVTNPSFLRWLCHSQPFAIEVIILMIWAIWSTRNDWIFNNKDPTTWKNVRQSLSQSLSCSFIGLKKYYPVIEQWLEGLALPYVFKALPLASWHGLIWAS
jgi:hypothetical protein